jgi:hypothetical protein
VCDDVGKVGIKRPCVEFVLEQGIGGVWGKDDGSSRLLRRGDFDFERGTEDRDRIVSLYLAAARWRSASLVGMMKSSRSANSRDSVPEREETII